jgi:hypothetical protein
MRHAKKFLPLAAAISVLVIIVVSSLATPTDAASVLDTAYAPAASIGDVFSINAWGEIAAKTNDDFSRALTEMHLEFELVEKGRRKARFHVLSGYFIINSTRYEVTEGVGFAGVPEDGRFNGTLVFGFRFNMTESGEEIAQVGFLGKVVRTEERGPILFMRGRVLVDDLTYALGQRGRIHRIET